jgi:2-polyprenyl-3-methyl-5-hydroxy-6-metoxy-1,4-benzoquinol methylase
MMQEGFGVQRQKQGRAKQHRAQTDRPANDTVPGYGFTKAGPGCSDEYLWPILERILALQHFPDRRAFDLGCGTGATSNMLSELGFEVIGVDPSASGLAIAKQSFSHVRFERGSAYDDLAARYGTFPLVVSLEVIEHCLYPRRVAQSIFDLLTPGGLGIISTPYHGYLKNLVLALIGGWDAHLTAVWDGGHIKFFSTRTLRQLLVEVGFRDITFMRAGRIPALAKSMIALVRKP